MSVTISDIRDMFMDALPSFFFPLPMTKEFHNLITCAATFQSGKDVLADALRIKYVFRSPNDVLDLGDLHVDERPIVHPCTRAPTTIDDFDITSLDTKGCVLDTIVNMFTSSLPLEANVSILGATVLQSWILGHNIKMSDFAHASYILIPAQVDANHWVLLYADKPCNVVYAMDSNAITPTPSVVKLAEHAGRFLGIKHPVLQFVRTPQQEQGSNDCAIYVCENIVKVLYNERNFRISRAELRQQAMKRGR